tara:strand:- start:61 stop:429 length:369 start_codon:yes stop_codon:yes gene_type:complete
MSLPKVIVVDFDGTLTFTDTLHEAVLSLIRTKLFILFLLPFWLIKGVANLKLQVAEHSVLDVTTLPYNLPFIDWLKEQKASGKEIKAEIVLVWRSSTSQLKLSSNSHIKPIRRRLWAHGLRF